MRLTAPHWLGVEPATDAPIRASRDEAALVDLARTDADAFAELYRPYLPRIYGFALRRTRSRQLAEDVTSGTFERALRGLGRFDDSRGGSFGPWLFRIAASELADHYRAGGPIREEVGEDPLLDALGSLPPRFQEVVSLRYLAGLDSAETAVAMAMAKPRTVLLSHRALGALRKALRSPRGDQPMTGGTSRAVLRRRLEDAGRVDVVPPDKGFEQWLDQHLRSHRQRVELVESPAPSRAGHPVWWVTLGAAVVIAIVALLVLRGENAPSGSSTAGIASGPGGATVTTGAASSAPASSAPTNTAAGSGPATSASPVSPPPAAVRTLAGDAIILGGARVRLRWVAYPDPDFSSYVLVRGRVGARPQYPAAGTDVVVATINDRTATTFVDSVRVAGGPDPVYLVVALDHDGRVVGRSAAIRARLR